ncbi:MAG: sugar phosphate isomerase/epimerase [Ruminococcaceae bacterium]|nr:sugar phosphate isomerase/epimerase [Oscillospiraceae bacterium]
MFKLGLSTNAKEISEKLFAEYNAAGIENMEVSTSYDLYEGLNYEKLLEYSKKYDVKLWSFHLPFMPFDEIDISDRSLKAHTLKYLKSLIEKATAIGIDKFIIHPSGEPIAEEDRRERLDCAKESLFELAEFAKAHGAVMAVENLPRTCLGRNSDEMKELLGAHEDLRSCFDTNHLLGERFEDYIQNIGNKIITMHTSDYDYLNERHWLPGEGKTDWKSLRDALASVNYSGIWLYEVAFVAPPSIIRERDLTCMDFVRNADEILNDKPITVLGTPISGLKHWTEM